MIDRSMIDAILFDDVVMSVKRDDDEGSGNGRSRTKNTSTFIRLPVVLMYVRNKTGCTVQVVNTLHTE
jgi:hypothetical protein